MILITGASRGLGLHLYSAYRSEEVPVIGTFNNSPPSDAPKGSFFKVDVSDYESVESWVGAIRSEIKDQLTLINCAGISYNSFLHKSDPHEWEKVIKVNLIGTYNCIRAILPIMREIDHGRIVTISSVVAQMGVPGTTPYAASKAGLWGLVKSLSKELKGKNITVNNINLGYFNAGMIEQVPTQIQDEVKSRIPKGRFGEPSELKNLIDYLRKADYTNGTSFDINGGLQ